MSGFFLEQSVSFWEKPTGSLFALIVVFFGMIFLMYYVTRIKTKNQIQLLAQIEHEKKKFKLLAGQISGISFLYQPDKDEMVLIRNESYKIKRAGILEKEETLIKDFSKKGMENAGDFFQDVKDFDDFINEIKKKKSGINRKYLLKKENASSVKKWIEVKADYLSDDDNASGVAVGTICVAEQKIDDSEERYDLASGVLKEDIIKKEIQYGLSQVPDGIKLALLLVKVGDYSQYTDNFSGDIPERVDKRMGNCINKMFRENDLYGRISDDTYVILMDHITSREDLLKKTEDFNNLVNNVHRESEGGALKVNFGISLYPMDGEDYDSLYDKAFIALNDAVRDDMTAKCY